MFEAPRLDVASDWLRVHSDVINVYLTTCELDCSIIQSYVHEYGSDRERQDKRASLSVSG